MTQRQDDLTELKHVGPSRMKLLNDHGIRTIKQLIDVPEEKLAEIKSIGNNYARMIKNAAAEYDGKSARRWLEIVPSVEKRKTEKMNLDFKKKIRRLNRALDRMNENLKPLGKKKYLVLYIDLKKRSSKLRARLEEITEIREGLPKEIKKNIIQEAEALSSFLKKSGQKPKKKKYREIISEVQAFSKMLRDIISTSETMSVSHRGGK